MKVIDLFDDEAVAVADEREQNGARITSREGRKAAKKLSNENPQLGWDVITNSVQAYCSMNPAVRDIPTIVRRCEEQLKAPKPPAGNASAGKASNANANVIDYTDYNEDEVVMHVVDSQDEECVVSTTTPLLEVLRLFPNARRDYVTQLLQNNANSVEMVVQSMLDKGYEKEAAASSNSSAPAAPTVDYASSSWETSAAYRKDALSELQRNFPFLAPASLALYFKREKHHFYHALTGIEKVVKIPALHFTQCRVQNIVATLNSGTTNTAAPATTTNNTSTTNTSAKASSISAKAGPGPVTIDLMDSQPPVEVEFEEVSGLLRSSSRSSQQGTSTLRKRAASIQAADLLRSPGSSKKSRRTASPPKCLNKDQLYELRQRCDKDATGLVLKSSVVCTYTAVEDNISYIMQPLDSVLASEMEYIRTLRVKEMLQADQLAAERLNEELATSEGSLMECGCCYGEYAFEALVQCSEGHLFCKMCLQRYCEQTVFGDGRSVLKCMNTAEVCTGFFSDTMLRHSLPEKVFEKFNQALSRDALSAAHMEGLVTCCHCSVPMLLEEDAGNVLHCPYCNKETCRLCGEPSHVPLRCSEVEKKGDTSARLSVEEAMTQARLRECHKCKTRFYKTEGCNKMTCRCGAIICYICRQDISKTGYQHFCQTAHCTHAACKKCRLFTDTLEDDRVAMKEAGLQTLQLEQQKQQAEGAAGAGGSGVKSNAEKPGAKVDLEKLLEASNKPAGANAAARAPGAVPVHPHMQHMQHPGGAIAAQFPVAAQYPLLRRGLEYVAPYLQAPPQQQQQQAAAAAARAQQQFLQEQMCQQQQQAREAARQQREAQQEQRRAAAAARKAEAVEAKRVAGVQRAADAAERNRQAEIQRVRTAAAPTVPRPAATATAVAWPPPPPPMSTPAVVYKPPVTVKPEPPTRVKPESATSTTVKTEPVSAVKEEAPAVKYKR